ncbi:hypothetical protein BLA29_002197, partial [Euroglyphus maynei]
NNNQTQQRQPSKSVGRTPATSVSNFHNNVKPLTSGKNSESHKQSSATSNTVSYTMAVNSKTRSINSTSSPGSTLLTTTSASNTKLSNGNNSTTTTINNGVKIVSAIYKPSNKSQMFRNNNIAYNNNHHHVTIKSETNETKSSSPGTSFSASTTSTTTTATSSNMNEKLNFASVAAGSIAVSSVGDSYHHNMALSPSNNSSSSINITSSPSTSKQIQHTDSIITDDKQTNPSFAFNSNNISNNVNNNRQFVSPNSSSSTSSAFSASATGSLSIQTCVANNNENNNQPHSQFHHHLQQQQQQQALHSNPTPIGHVRSAPCTPPIANYCSPGTIGSKFIPANSNLQSQQLQQTLSDVLYIGGDSQQQQLQSNNANNKLNNVDSFLLNSAVSSTTSEYANLFPQQHTNNGNNQMHSNFLLSNMMINSNIEPALSNHHGLIGHQPAISSPINRASVNSNFLDHRPITPNIYEHHSSKLTSSSSSNRSSQLNPNAPDFASRSNSFSTNTLSQPNSMLSLNLNQMNPLSQSAQTVSNFGANMAAPNHLQAGVGRPNFLAAAGVSAPNISNDVRQMIVNYSMNIFQNQVPKRHQEAAARLAHSFAQSEVLLNNNAGPHLPHQPPPPPPPPLQTQFGQPVADRLNMIQQFLLQQQQQQQHGQLRAATMLGVANNIDSYSSGLQQQQQQQTSTLPLMQHFRMQQHSLMNNNNSNNHGNFSNYDLYTTTASSSPTSSLNQQQKNDVVNNLSTVENNGDSNGIQQNKIKPPAPIGTERAQRKNPTQQHSTASSMTTNPLFGEHNSTIGAASGWLDNCEDLTVDSSSSSVAAGGGSHLPPFGTADFANIFPTQSTSNDFDLLNNFGTSTGVRNNLTTVNPSGTRISDDSSFDQYNPVGR